MGFDGVNDSYRFRVGESSAEIQVDHEYSVYPSFDLDKESWRILEVRRSGRLTGPFPGAVAWDLPWLHEPKPDDPWERLAEILLFHESVSEDIARRAAKLRADAGLPPGYRLRSGESIGLRITPYVLIVLESRPILARV
jgi:hypothetical protein